MLVYVPMRLMHDLLILISFGAVFFSHCISFSLSMSPWKSHMFEWMRCVFSKSLSFLLCTKYYWKDECQFHLRLFNYEIASGSTIHLGKRLCYQYCCCCWDCYFYNYFCRTSPRHFSIQINLCMLHFSRNRPWQLISCPTLWQTHYSSTGCNRSSYRM